MGALETRLCGLLLLLDGGMVYRTLSMLSLLIGPKDIKHDVALLT